MPRLEKRFKDSFMLLKTLSIVYPIFLKIVYFRTFKIAHGRFLPGQILLMPGSYVGTGGIIIIKPHGSLCIGKDTYIGEYCNIRVDKKIQIGSGCKIGQFVTIVDGDYKFGNKLTYSRRTSKNVKIGNNVFVGANACILKNASVPDDAVIPCLSTIK